MKRAIYLIVLGIITAGCILWRVGNSVVLNTGGNDSGFDTVSVSDEKTDSFTKIDMEVDTMDITVVPGDSYSISYTALKKDAPEYYVKDDTLYVTQTQKQTVILGLNVSRESKFVITVPEGTVLSDVDITADVGDADLRKIQTQRFTCEMDVGDLKIEDSVLGETEIEMNVGDLELESVSLEHTKVTSDVGDVEISVAGNQEDYSMDLSADVGEVSLNGKNQKRGFTSDDGKYELTVTTDVGDIQLDFKK